MNNVKAKCKIWKRKQTSCVFQFFFTDPLVEKKNMITVEYIYPAISLGRVLHVWADSVSPLMSTTASRDKFKPIRIRENLAVSYNGW